MSNDCSFLLFLETHSQAYPATSLARPYLSSQAGKSGGEHYTSQEVSELLARLTVIGKTRVIRVYETFMPRWIQTRANYDLVA